jgi:hypothetical protein
MGGHNFGKYGDVMHWDYTKQVLQNLKDYIKQKGITKKNKMTWQAMRDFVKETMNGKNGLGQTDKKIRDFNRAIKKQARIFQKANPKLALKAVPEQEIIARGKSYAGSRSRLAALSVSLAMASVFIGAVEAEGKDALTLIANNEKANNHFRNAIRYLLEGKPESLVFARRELLGRDGLGGLAYMFLERGMRAAWDAMQDLHILFNRAAERRNDLEKQLRECYPDFEE